MSQLQETVLSFMNCFNEADLDGAMALLAQDAVYIDEFGSEHRGHTALKSSLGPILDGSYGKLKYVIEEAMFDEAEQRSTVVWTLEIQGENGSRSRMQGLDIIHVEGTQVTSKNCYIKSKEVLVENVE